MTESEYHKELKEEAKKFLESLGFEDIRTEYATGVWYCGHYASYDREANVDVVGFKDAKGTVRRWVTRAPSHYEDFPASWSRMAIVECGGTLDGKLRTLARHFEEVYTRPYGGKIERVKRVPKREWWELE